MKSRLLAIGFIVPRNLPPLLFSLPFLALRVLAREINKKMHPFRWWRRVFPTLG